MNLFIDALLLLNLFFIFAVLFIESNKPEEALLWVFILALLPIVGMIIYIFLGSTIQIKLAYYMRNKQVQQKYRQSLLHHIKKLKEEEPDLKQSYLTQLERMIHFNLIYNESVLQERNEVEVFTAGKKKYEALFRDIREAKESIHVQYYTIHNDIVGQELCKLLTQKAKEGVEVRVIFDALASIMTPNKLFRPIKEHGGYAKRYRLFLTQFRNHRKIVVIDGKIGYMGGMNIGTQYANQHKVKTPWRDTHLRIQGDAVYSLQYYFLRDWIYLNKGRDFTTKIQWVKYFQPHTVSNILPIQMITGGVEDNKQHIKMGYLSMMKEAKQRIILQSPYFVPDSSVLDSFRVLTASGVDVVLMLPKVKASFFLYHAGNFYIEKLLQYGARIFLYEGYIHAKTLLVDDNVTCVGSVNMDIRSLEINDELCAFLYSPEFNQQYATIIENDLQHCVEFDYEAFRNRKKTHKLLERIFRLFAPLM